MGVRIVGTSTVQSWPLRMMCIGVLASEVGGPAPGYGTGGGPCTPIGISSPYWFRRVRCSLRTGPLPVGSTGVTLAGAWPLPDEPVVTSWSGERSTRKPAVTKTMASIASARTTRRTSRVYVSRPGRRSGPEATMSSCPGRARFPGAREPVHKTDVGTYPAPRTVCCEHACQRR